MRKLKINAVFNDDMPSDLGEIDGWQRLDLWNPPDKRLVRLSLTMDIGMQDMVGTNLFWLEVCTTDYAKKYGTHSKSRYVLLVDEFDWLTIKPMIVARVEACQRDDWDRSVAELRKHFHWEYETKRTSRKKLEPLPKDFFPEPDWGDDDDDEPDKSGSVH